MGSVIERAKRVCREGSGRSFLRKGWGFALRKFFTHVVWNVLPKNETLRFISRSRVLTTLYFFLTGTFYREQRTVLCGLAEYHELEEHRVDNGVAVRVMQLRREAQ